MLDEICLRKFWLSFIFKNLLRKAASLKNYFILYVRLYVDWIILYVKSVMVYYFLYNNNRETEIQKDK